MIPARPSAESLNTQYVNRQRQTQLFNLLIVVMGPCAPSTNAGTCTADER